MTNNTRESIRKMNELVEQLYQQGQYDEAMKHALQASEKARKHLSQEDDASLTALFNLATLYFTLGDYERAEPLCNQVLKMQRSLLGEYHPDITMTMNNLASLYYMIGEYKEAEKLYSQVVEARRSTLGEVHLGTATSISNLAAVYSATGAYKQAKPLFLEALTIQREIVRDANHHVSMTLNNLAALYESLGDYEQAQSTYEQALDTMRIAVGEQHADVAKLFNNLAQLAYTRGDFVKAEALYNQALSVQRSVWSQPHPDMAKTLGNLAVLYVEQGVYEKAEQFYTQSLNMAQQLFGEEHPDVATSLDGLSVLYKELGSYQKAIKLCRQALKIRRKVLGKGHPEVASSLYNLGVLYYLIGDYVKAQSSYEQALEIQRAVFADDHRDRARTLNALAVLYRARGDFDQAETWYQQALTIQQKILGEQHLEVAATLGNLAGLYRDMGDYQQSELLSHQSLKIERTLLGNQHPHVATSLSNLALLYYMQENYAQAEILYQQALEIRRTALGGQHPDVAGSLINLAMLYYATKRYEQAVQYCLQALDIERIALGAKHPEIAATLSNLAVLYLSQGDYDSAGLVGQQALALQRTLLGEQHPDVGGSISNLAVIYAANNQETKALQYMQEFHAIDDHMIELIFSMGSEQQRLSYLSTLQGDLDAFLSLVLHCFSASPDAVKAAANLVLRRKGMTSEVLVAQQEVRLRNRYPQLTPYFQELMDIKSQITRKIVAGPEQTENSQHYRLLLDKLHARKEKIEVYLTRHIPEMRLAQRTRHVTYQRIVETLPQGSALVEFVRLHVFNFQAVLARGDSLWMPDRYLAFVIVAEEPDFLEMLDLGEADALDNLLAAFRRAVTGEVEDRNPAPTLRIPDEHQEHTQKRQLRVPFSPVREGDKNNGQALRRVLFDPLEAVLKGRKRLFLAPDGDLTRLPFEILPTNEEKYLLETYQISYVSTGRDVLRPASSSHGSTSPLIVADPDFDLRLDQSPIEASQDEQAGVPNSEYRSLHFNRLSGTHVEGKRIATLLGVQPLIGQAALESTVKACHSPRILHMATHGFFLPNKTRIPHHQQSTSEGRLANFIQRRVSNPLLRSGLALAGANSWNRHEPLPENAEDGLLTAEDVSSLDLLHTQLVVLSACETGLGEVHSGEGVFGLRRSFTLAGARTLVMSLWKIPDQQTQELMENFYHYVLSGQSYTEALRAAQLAMKAKYAQPFYWGAFICQGAVDASVSAMTAE